MSDISQPADRCYIAERVNKVEVGSRLKLEVRSGKWEVEETEGKSIAGVIIVANS